MAVRKTTTHQMHPLDIRQIKRSALPIIYHDAYSVEPWPSKHPFRMPKFTLLHQHLIDNEFNFRNLYSPEIPSDHDISIAHTTDYIHAITTGQSDVYKSINLPYSDWLQHRAKLSLNGTLSTCNLALQYGMATHLSGGYHHSHRDHGSGFCIFNDLAFAALHLISNSQSNGIRNICILDFDVHQGDGTASILQDMDNILTVSVHCESNFPFIKQISDIDLALEDGLNDVIYLDKIRTLMDDLIRNKHKNNYPIDLVIYDAGVDVHQHDKLGKLNITDEGLIARDNLVFETCINHDIPIACVIGGGYDVDDTILAQRHGFMHWNALTTWNKYNLG
eukprot:9914_1